MTLTLRRFLLVIAMPLLLSACQTPSESDSDSKAAGDTAMQDRSGKRLQALPVESEWILAEAKATGLSRPEARQISLRVSHNRLSGNSGCNQFSAGYAMSESKLSIGMPAATKRGCPGAAGEIEQALFALLPELTEAASYEDQLILRNAAGAELRFAPVKSADEPPAGQ